MDSNKRIEILEEFFVDLSRKVDIVVDFLGKMVTSQDKSNTQLTQLIDRIERVEEQQVRSNQKLDQIDKRLDTQIQKHIQTNQNLNQLSVQVQEINHSTKDLSQKIDRLLRLEDRVAALEKAVFK